MRAELLMILSLSLSGSLLALLLLACRPLLRRVFSRAFGYYIWALVLLRLVLPVSLPINAMDALFQELAAEPAPIAAVPLRPHVDVEEKAEAPSEAESATEGVPPALQAAPMQGTDTVFPAQSERQAGLWSFLQEHLLAIWAAGVLVSLLWYASAYLLFAHRLPTAPPDPQDAAVFQGLHGKCQVRLVCSPHVSAPMLLGLFRPCIVLPAHAYVQNGMEQELVHILQHELTHHRRRDLLYKWAVVLITSLHWFNPLMYWIRKEIERDCELACDEAVIARMSNQEKQRYGETLLTLAAKQHSPTGILATTLYGEKAQLKERLQGIMQHRKRPAWVGAVSIALALCLAGCGAVLGMAQLPPQTIAANPTASEPEHIPAPEPEFTPTLEERPAPIPASADRSAALIAGYATAFQGEPSAQAANIEKAAALLDGLVLQPGEEWSFNEHMGPISLETGWKMAPGVSMGKEYAAVPGGGLCLVSTTLYNALLRGNIEITYHRNHPVPSAYAEFGLDATVDSSGIDFRFRNSTDAPLRVVAFIADAGAQQRSLTIELYGVPLPAGISYHPRSELIERIAPGEAVYVEDTSLLRGEEYIEIAARDRIVAEVYLDKFIDGDLSESKFLYKATYRGNPAEIRVGASDPA